MGNVSSSGNISPKVASFLNTIINQVSNDTVSVCDNSGTNVQSISFSNLDLTNCSVHFTNINQTIDSKFTNDCIQINKNLINDTIDESIAKAIQNDNLDPTTNAKIQNVFDTSFSSSSLSECLSNSLNSQSINGNNITVICPTSDPVFIVDKIDQYISSNYISSCLQKNTQLVDGLSNILDGKKPETSSSSSSEPNNTTSKPILDNNATIALIVVFVSIILIIISILLYVYRDKIKNFFQHN